MNLLNILIGRRLANAEAQRRKITTLEGFAAMGLDGLSSSAYGPEAALIILMAAGSSGLGEIRAVMLAVLLLLLMLFVSYWQTIEAYPSNAGSYTVARENLGANTGLLAATALMIDYVLNVAVGISAGVGAFTSAVPQLHAYTLPLCLGILALITIVNLRGTMEAGIVFSVPTYLFVASFGGLLLLGVAKALAAGGNPVPVVPPPPVLPAAGAVTLWLLLRSFASGCTAMTGVEAVSNGISAFRDPSTKYAHRTFRHRSYVGSAARRDRLSRARLPRRRPGPIAARLSKRLIAAGGGYRGARDRLFRRNRNSARCSLSFRQYELCRLSAALSDRGA